MKCKNNYCISLDIFSILYKINSSYEIYIKFSLFINSNNH